MSGEFDPRITAYFGDAVLRAGFMPTPHLFLRHYAQLGLDSAHAMFLLQVMEIAWDLGDPPRTGNDFARRMGVGKKAIQRYTSHIEELGLINVFSQFDDSGAQVENCYDLSPLFARLAHFAPEPTPGGSLRRQQRRTGALAAASTHAAQASPAHQPTQPPRQIDPPSPGQIDPPPPGSLCPGGLDQRITPGEGVGVPGAGITRSGLKAEQRILKKQQEQLLIHGTSSAEQPGQHPVVLAANQPGAPSAGWAIRWQHALSPADIAQNTELLRRMQIDNPVRAVLASAYTSADLWVVRLWSLVKGWSPALTVSQVYDKTRRKACLSIELAAQHDAVGRLLAALDPHEAETCVELVLRHCPQASPLCNEPFFQSAAPPVRAAVEAIWQMVAQLRGYPAHPLSAGAWPGVTAPPAPDPQLHQIWQSTLARLQADLPTAEFATWLAPSMLLGLEQHGGSVCAVVGVPHIFARERLTTTYGARLSELLALVLEQPVTVQIEIDAGIGATSLPDAQVQSLPATAKRGVASRVQGG